MSYAEGRRQHPPTVITIARRQARRLSHRPPYGDSRQRPPARSS
jgi:hypothetical protein